jgi:UDPglucose 6-dehydrogenase
MKITIIGTGYVGLVTGTCFADKGNQVICIDNDVNKVEKLKQGIPPIYEPGLSELVKKNYEAENITFSTDIKMGVKESDIIYMCLPTPQGGDGQADLSIVLKVAEEIGEYFNGYKIVVNKSTVPVGTAEAVRKQIEKKATVDFDVASNPEFLREGDAINNFMHPDRVVLGSDKKVVLDTLVELYRPFVDSTNMILTTDIYSSELIKYASNAFLATKISFINEMSNLAEFYGADIKDIAYGMGLDKRIGGRFLNAGIGYGGSCFPKDVSALIYQGREAKTDLSIVTAAKAANSKQRAIFINKILAHYKAHPELPKSVSILGLSFKPDTDDVRESPAIDVVQALINNDFRVSVYDPAGLENFKSWYGFDINYAESTEDALQGTATTILLTDWKEFKSPDILDLLEENGTKTVLDGRNIFLPEQVEPYSFDYLSVGRKDIIRSSEKA